jgi:hypothetical protein
LLSIDTSGNRFSIQYFVQGVGHVGGVTMLVDLLAHYLGGWDYWKEIWMYMISICCRVSMHVGDVVDT